MSDVNLGYAKPRTDCAVIGNYSTENFAVAVEILNTVMHTCSIHQNKCVGHTVELDI